MTIDAAWMAPRSAMLSLLFWNLNAQQNPSVETRLTRIAANYRVDVVVLAEIGLPIERIEAALSAQSAKSFRRVALASERLHSFTHLPAGSVQPRHDSLDGRWTVVRLQHGVWDLLLAAVHLHSKLHRDDKEQLLQATLTVSDIVRLEDEIGHTQTIVIGDFNMNPFESGMVANQAFHAVMSNDVARSIQRKVDSRDYRFFYNPMWGLLGDRTPGPPGTLYYTGSGPVEFFWHTFDQVLVRPGLARLLDQVQVLETDGVETLLTDSGRPSRSSASDHLPIYVRLKPTEAEVTP